MRSRTRFRVLALISIGTMINYLDRTVLGVAAPGLSSELHISPAVMGIVFSAFSWSYAAAQIPGGWVLDRIGTRLTYFLSVSFWSLFTLVQGFAGGISSLLAFRLGLGVAAGTAFAFGAAALATHARYGVVMHWEVPNVFWGFGFYLDTLSLMAVGFAAPVLAALAVAIGWRRSTT